jgi:hypothetical protein
MKKTPIDQLRRIEEIKSDLESRLEDLSEKRDTIIERLCEEPVRNLEVTGTVLEFRGKALKNKEIRSFLEDHKIPIDDIALVIFLDERIRGFLDGKVTWGYPVQSHVIEDPEANQWEFTERFVYGGPNDKVRILFRESKNNRYYVCGFMTNFPMKAEKKAA